MVTDDPLLFSDKHDFYARSKGGGAKFFWAFWRFSRVIHRRTIADERGRFQELLEVHRQFSDEAQQKMLGLVRELDARISDLPKRIKAGLDPQQIAKILGESLRQHFLQSGVQDTVKALQSTRLDGRTKGTLNRSAQSVGFSWRRCRKGGASQQPAGVFL